jgi:hypothetical protein
MKNVDLVIFAGDLFDHNRIREDLIRFVTEQLQRLTVPVVILPGNHDCLIPDSIFDKTELWEDCGKLHIFMDPRGETLEIPELGVSLWGKHRKKTDSGILLWPTDILLVLTLHYSQAITLRKRRSPVPVGIIWPWGTFRFFDVSAMTRWPTIVGHLLFPTPSP